MASNIGSEGSVYNANLSRYADQSLIPPLLGPQGDSINSDIHGKAFTAAWRGNLFWANRTAVTIPVVTSGVTSVFTLWNPPSSGVIAEMFDTEIGMVLATTVVDVVGWYFSPPQLTAAGTFTTPGVAGTNFGSCRIGDAVNNKVQFYSAYVHSGTPVRADIIGSFGATTDPTSQLPSKFYEGRLLLPPGIAMSICMSTAAGTSSGLDPSCRWAEWPAI